jgi:hypothetical protein
MYLTGQADPPSLKAMARQTPSSLVQATQDGFTPTNTDDLQFLDRINRIVQDYFFLSQFPDGKKNPIRFQRKT